jgi:hypothetical protein
MEKMTFKPLQGQLLYRFEKYGGQPLPLRDIKHVSFLWPACICSIIFDQESNGPSGWRSNDILPKLFELLTFQFLGSSSECHLRPLFGSA